MYTQTAKPTTINGVLYDSKLESRVAKLLHKSKIEFYPHVKFDLRKPCGKAFTYTVDFAFKEYQSFAGISHPVLFLEVKGALKPHDFVRNSALEYVCNAKGFIVLNSLVEYWENYGVLKQPAPIWGSTLEKGTSSFVMKRKPNGRSNNRRSREN